MDADPRLAAHRRVWQKKPALRKIYADYYRRITCHCTNGQTLEIGAGSGHIREHMDQVFMADILPAEWLDVAADAQQLPFGDESLSNIVMVDVLHHIERPTALFDEVTRVLRPGGKMVMLDPAITIGSWPIYKFLHSEPVNIRAFFIESSAPLSFLLKAYAALVKRRYHRRSSATNNRNPNKRARKGSKSRSIDKRDGINLLGTIHQSWNPPVKG